jgi:hypothetical protein
MSIGSAAAIYNRIENSAGNCYLGVNADGNTALSADNTGNQLLFFTEATEKMRISAAGVLGIGVTPNAWRTGLSDRAIQVGSVASFWSDSNVATDVGYNLYMASGNNHKYATNSQASNYQQYQGQHRWYTAPSGTAGNTITFTQAMTLDASGNLGVGTSSPDTRLHVAGGASTELRITTSGSLAAGASAFVRFGGSNSATSGYVGYGGSANECYLWNALSGATIFGTANTERMRIDSSGRLLVRTTTGTGNEVLATWFNSSGGASTSQGINILDQGSASGANFMVFRKSDEAGIGGIARNGTSNAVLYNTTSDYRLKEEITPMSGALERVSRLKPVTWKWKDCDANGEGFIAHEVQEVVPSAVSGQKDALDEKGKPAYQGMDASYLVATLTAAIQELNAKVMALEAQLENK